MEDSRSDFVVSKGRLIAVSLRVILNNIFGISGGEQKKRKEKKCNTPFSITGRTALDSTHYLDERGSVVIARFLSKAKDGKEDERDPNHEPPIQFPSHLAYRSSTPLCGRHLEDIGEVGVFFF